MKSYFKGLIIGGGGALLAGYGIALLIEAVQGVIIMVTEQGYSVASAFLHTFGDVFGLILLAVGVYVIYTGLRKAKG